ncbi:SPASM domain-containing protein [Patescibacteria group bacterium]|nr:SPASM domain-containing protein [Patescibacteria group bacterium]
MACKDTPGFEPCMLSLENFKIMLDKMPFLEVLLLFNWGEPFLNPQFFDMIKYTKTKGLYALTYSNFSFKKDYEFFKNIIKSGLDDLLISIDGTTQQNYEKFRKGGNLDLVFSNIKLFNKAKKELKCKRPRLYWHFTVDKFNEHEITQAKKIAKELKIKLILNHLIIYSKVNETDLEEIKRKRKYWLPKKRKYILKLNDVGPKLNYRCPNLFSLVCFDAAGYAMPCRFLTDKNDAMGNLLENSFEEIWYGQKYLSSRSLFTKNKYSKKVETVCDKCTMYKKRTNIF